MSAAASTQGTTQGIHKECGLDFLKSQHQDLHREKYTGTQETGRYLQAPGARPAGYAPGGLKAAHSAWLHHYRSHAIDRPHIRQRSQFALQSQEPW